MRRLQLLLADPGPVEEVAGEVVRCHRDVHAGSRQIMARDIALSRVPTVVPWVGPVAGTVKLSCVPGATSSLLTAVPQQVRVFGGRVVVASEYAVWPSGVAVVRSRRGVAVLVPALELDQLAELVEQAVRRTSSAMTLPSALSSVRTAAAVRWLRRRARRSGRRWRPIPCGRAGGPCRRTRSPSRAARSDATSGSRRRAGRT